MTAPDSRDSVERVVAEMRKMAADRWTPYGVRQDVIAWADRLQALAAPAAGKGVDDAHQVIAHMRDIADVAERYTVEELRDVLRERAAELEAVLTRQPVAGDGK